MTIGGEGTPGRPVSDVTRKKISETRKRLQIATGANNPMFGKGAERSGDKNTFFGKSHTIETKEKISTTKKGKKNKLISIPDAVKDLIINLSKIKSPYQIKKHLEDNNIKPKRKNIWSIHIIERISLNVSDNIMFKARDIIIDMFNSGNNIKVIINFLNSNNLPSRTENGWSRFAIMSIIQKYKGQ